MSKVTSKLQVTIPKAIAEQYAISPGDEIDWVPAADSVRIVLARARADRRKSSAARLRLFEAATERQRSREQRSPRSESASERGWTREELYERGGAG